MHHSKAFDYLVKPKMGCGEYRRAGRQIIFHRKGEVSELTVTPVGSYVRGVQHGRLGGDVEPSVIDMNISIARGQEKQLQPPRSPSLAIGENLLTLEA